MLTHKKLIGTQIKKYPSKFHGAKGTMTFLKAYLVFHFLITDLIFINNFRIFKRKNTLYYIKRSPYFHFLTNPSYFV